MLVHANRPAIYEGMREGEVREKERERERDRKFEDKPEVSWVDGGYEPRSFVT